MHRSIRRRASVTAGVALAVMALVPAGIALADTIDGENGSPPPGGKQVVMPNGQTGYVSEDTPDDPAARRGKRTKGKAVQIKGNKGTRVKGGRAPVKVRNPDSGSSDEAPKDSVKGENGSPPPGGRQVTLPDGSTGYVSEDTPADHVPGS